MRHDHVAKDHVNRLLFEQGQRGFAAIGFETDESQSFAHGDAELADALLVVDDQHADAKVFPVARIIHSSFPNVLATTSINCCTRKGFSTQGAPVARNVATVSSLAMFFCYENNGAFRPAYIGVKDL